MSATIVEANETRGTGPTWDHWPSSLPQISYVTEDGAILCVTCANRDGSTERDADKQWRIIGAQVNDEPTQCQHCYRMIVS
jgi:hypothetical protein